MFRPLFVLAALTLPVALTVPAAAQEVDCANAITQQDMNQCAYNDWAAVDEELNQVYGKAMALLKTWDEDLPKDEKGGADALKEAQRAWITFRDKACEAEGYAMKGGSAEPLLVYGCMRQLTEERVGHLKGMIDAYVE